MRKKWVLQEIPDQQTIEKLTTDIRVPATLATLLAQRGVSSYDQAKDFFRPDLDQLHDPFLMKDMDHAVRRLVLAMHREEKILVYGDYDVDGTCSVALVYYFLREIYDKVDYYIPDRYQEGYGVSERGIQRAVENEVALLITLDCGIRAVKLINKARKQNIDCIVCDHHRPGNELPPAHAILNPKQAGCKYPYKELCGCGVGFKLLQGFCQQTEQSLEPLYRLLDFVAIAIGADIVPITGENRLLAYGGIQEINQRPRPAWQALIQVAGIKPPLTIEKVVFGFAPRINAAGRIGHADAALRLMLEQDEEKAFQYADALHQKNAERRHFDSSITDQALSMIKADQQLKEARSTVLFNQDWHKGVVGIVASRCIEKHYRPTIILTESNGKATGSARSVEGFDVHDAIAACADLLEQFGGHASAAGLTLKVENVSKFRERFEQAVAERITEEQRVPQVPVDMMISLTEVTPKLYNIIRQMAPFGPGNMRPVFVSENLHIANQARLLREQHLKLEVCQNGCAPLNAIGFRMPHLYDLVQKNQPFKMAYSVTENHYNGKTTLQLEIKDLQLMDEQ
ncbi:single-stranded-DNA-specific exonuclease RecJ [Tunicatimonas pelagia]|uniref:single-stranded-DNA-specific exonuclease RecJ n=1 Tax=Tunicatimonas pelagia TaxID=931531 RepID=UPI002665B563|nr:single-stranded-DNA-specific exonuclease RecJ [Tunicatimonas pelagia]WKN45170.1 single-stranded-DNA-specific exonuclease RecJ [Tunicatimonas pelagia]